MALKDFQNPREKTPSSELTEEDQKVMDEIEKKLPQAEVCDLLKKSKAIEGKHLLSFYRSYYKAYKEKNPDVDKEDTESVKTLEHLDEDEKDEDEDETLTKMFQEHDEFFQAELKKDREKPVVVVTKRKREWNTEKPQCAYMTEKGRCRLVVAGDTKYCGLHSDGKKKKMKSPEPKTPNLRKKNTIKLNLTPVNDNTERSIIRLREELQEFHQEMLKRVDVLSQLEMDTVHKGIKCNNCLEKDIESDILGYRFQCPHCEQFNLCSKCFRDGENTLHFESAHDSDLMNCFLVFSTHVGKVNVELYLL